MSVASDTTATRRGTVRMSQKSRSIQDMRSDQGRIGPVGAHPRKRGHCSNAGGLSAVLRQRLYTLVGLHSAVLCNRLPGTTNGHIKFADVAVKTACPIDRNTLRDHTLCNSRHVS